MNHFTVEVLTPSSVVAKNIPAESVLIPTVGGQLNVLPEHTHIISKLETGVLSVFGGADDPDRHFSISAGICKVLKDKIIILSNTAEEDREISEERAVRALENAQGVLKNLEKLDADEVVKFQRKVERAQLRIQLARSAKR